LIFGTIKNSFTYLLTYLHGEKEHAELSGHSGRGHLVLVCAERCRPRPTLKVNKLHQRPAVQMGVAKSDASEQIWF